ncbi:MAG: hypothetical protein IJY50_01355 [Clostridia bacterium]|nr:hypothetical protein [Clostridia bacterium]
MHFKDMKWYMKLLMGLLVLLLSPFLLLAIVLMVAIAVLMPLFEIPIYCHSAYFRTFGEKYSWFITRTPRYLVFRRLRKYRPDIAFPPAGTNRFHCCTCGSTLIYFGIFDRFVFDAEARAWCAAASENDEPLELSEALAEYPHQPDGEKYPTTDVKILTSAKLFYAENLHRALTDPRFIIYKSNRELKKKLMEL